MKKIKNFFSLKINVYYEDTDAGGFVYHANYLKYAERARTEMLKKIFPDIQKLLGNDFMFVVRDMNIKYNKPCVLFDSLNVKTSLKELKKTSLVLNQKICKDNFIFCDLTVRLVWVEKKKMKPSRINYDLISRLNSIKIV